MSDKHSESIHIHGARQNNLKNLDVDLPLNELLVVTGVSGVSGCSLRSAAKRLTHPGLAGFPTTVTIHPPNAQTVFGGTTRNFGAREERTLASASYDDDVTTVESLSAPSSEKVGT